MDGVGVKERSLSSRSSPASSPRSEFIGGVKGVAPILLGVIPFGMIYGVLAIGAGLSASAAQAMSAIVFAGSAQFVGAQLFKVGTPGVVLVLTTMIVNLRHVLYSASLAPYLKHLSWKWKALLAYLLTDEAYAVAIIRYMDGPPLPPNSGGKDSSPVPPNSGRTDGSPVPPNSGGTDGSPVRPNSGGTDGPPVPPIPGRTDAADSALAPPRRACPARSGIGGLGGPHAHWYVLGAGLGLWLTWQTSTAIGILLGAQIPSTWALDFTLALTFIALVVPALKDRPSLAAALSAGIVAVAAASWPYKMGLMAAALTGIIIGLWAETAQETASRRQQEEAP